MELSWDSAFLDNIFRMEEEIIEWKVFIVPVITPNNIYEFRTFLNQGKMPFLKTML